MWRHARLYEPLGQSPHLGYQSSGKMVQTITRESNGVGMKLADLVTQCLLDGSESGLVFHVRKWTRH